jgi:hypothetical protein
MFELPQKKTLHGEARATLPERFPVEKQGG